MLLFCFYKTYLKETVSRSSGGISGTHARIWKTNEVSRSFSSLYNLFTLIQITFWDDYLIYCAMRKIYYIY